MIRYVIIATPLYITGFWAIVFLTNRFSANKARFWLGIFMAIVTVLYSCHAVYFLGYHNLYLKLDGVYLGASLSVYPMYYIYVRLLTCDQEIRRNYFKHFVPAVLLAMLLSALGLMASADEKRLYFDSVLVKNSIPETGASFLVIAMSLVFFVSRIIFAVQVLLYLGLGFQLLKKYDRRISNFYSNLQGRELVWVKLLTFSFLLTSIVSVVVNIIGRGYFLNGNFLLALPSVLFSLLFFIIGLQGNKQDHRIIEFEKDEMEDTSSEVNFSIKRQDMLKADLYSLFDNDKLYLNPDLRISDLCRLLNTNRTYLSRLMNDDFGLSFNDFVNRYRVVYSIQIIEQDISEKYSQIHIAEQSGFGSVSSFNRAFRKEMGIAPSEHRRNLSRRR